MYPATSQIERALKQKEMSLRIRRCLAITLMVFVSHRGRGEGNTAEICSLFEQPSLVLDSCA